VALAEAGDPGAALTALDALPTAATQAYPAYWVARAHVLKLAGAPGREAALQRAIGLTEDPRLREFLAASADRPDQPRPPFSGPA
jgi:RNA polymerase sigma-70 factor (ECF subfamily)